MKVADLTELTAVQGGDLLHIVDVSDTTHSADGTSKKITRTNLVSGLATSTDLTNHIADTTTHGTTGDIVGTSDTQTLTNKTLTSPKINENVAVTATATEINVLDGITANTAELNILDGVTSTASELNALDGITSTASELNITDGGQTTEKVLNVQCKCRAYLNSAQNNTTSGSNIKVLLDAKDYDIGSDFDTANSRFVAPVTGYYMVSAVVAYSGLTANKRYAASIYVNGSQYSISMLSNGTDTVACKVALSDICYVQAGQYIELYSFHNDGVSTSDLATGTVNTFMAIHLLSI